MLRKIVFFVLLLAAGAATARAQTSRGPLVRIDWGLVGGVNFARYSGSGVSVSEKTGYQFGIAMGVGFGRISIRPEILYVHQRVDVTPDGAASSIALKSNSLEVPVLVSVRLLRPLRLYAGPVFTVLSSCKYNDAEGHRVDFGSIRPTASYAIGASLTLLRHLVIDARFNGHFSSSSNVMASDGSRVRLRANAFTIGVGYAF